ncbi:MAG: PocR ligand-binding domain-containing protein [Candidatus Brocadia sp.]|nr:PocR ligand-binding domain-containing protein [Candidatus Brocadia sp.]
MEPIKRLKIDFEKEIISTVQLYLMSILNTSDVVYDAETEVISEINASSYCKALRFVSERKDICLSFSRELARSAIHLKKSFEEICPGGLTHLSMPICLDENTVIGAHCVTISNPLRSRFSVYDIAAQFRIDAHILWDAVKKTPSIPRPFLKIAREQAILTTELMSNILNRMHTLKQSEASMSKKYHDIEAVVRNHKK